MTFQHTAGIRIPTVWQLVRLTRAERREQTRDDLIAAADRLFVEGGFHATSLDQIAAAAGYTKGAVYSNFASKEDLFFAVYERRARTRRRRWQLTEQLAGDRGAGLDAHLASDTQRPARARRRLAGGVLRVLGARDPPPGAARALRGHPPRASQVPIADALERGGRRATASSSRTPRCRSRWPAARCRSGWRSSA